MKELNLDQHQGYWSQVADSTAEWLGVPHLGTLEVVILFFLLVMSILVLLPWERWFRKDILTPLLGIYGLGCSFAGWHFHLTGWLVLLFALIGIGLLVGALKAYPTDR